MKKIFSLAFEDGSELVYQGYIPDKGELFDVFWIRSFDEIWHMKTVRIDLHPPVAQFVDQFIRSENGALEKKNSLECSLLPELPLVSVTGLQTHIPFEDRSLTTLISQATNHSSDEQRSNAHLHYKLAQPLIPLVMVLTYAPFALRFSRNRSLILFVAYCLLAYVGFLTLLDAMLILAENQVLPAKYAIWGPFAVVLFSQRIAQSSMIRSWLK